LILGVFVLGRFDWTARSNWPVLLVLGAGVLVAGRVWYLEQSSKLLLVPHLNTLPLSYFLPNPQQQWYFDRAGIVVVMAIAAAVVAAVLLVKKNFVPLFAICLVLGYLAVFSLFSRTFFHTRHLLSTELWFIIVCAIGLATLWDVIRVLAGWRGAVGGAAIAILLTVAVMNYRQIVLPTLSRDPDMPISEDYMHDVSAVQTYLLSRVQPDEVLVSTVYGLYATWEGRPVFQASYRITSQTPIDEILKLVDENAAGWLVMDKIRLDLSALSPRDLTRTGQIEYIGMFGDEYVWHWRRANARLEAPPCWE
jgi:hypothetical protein